MPKAWANKLLVWLERDEAENMSESEQLITTRARIACPCLNQRRLLDSFLEQDIERADYPRQESKNYE